MLSQEQTQEIENYARRIAYDYTMGCLGGDENKQRIASIKYETLVTTLRLLGIMHLPSIQYTSLYEVGNDLHTKGYERIGGKLRRRIYSEEDVI